MRPIDLSFPNVQYGSSESVWTLEPLLYKGGAAENIKSVLENIKKGALGESRLERLYLLEKMHESLTARYAGGGSRYTLRGTILKLRTFYTWADQRNIDLTEQNIYRSYSDWTSDIWVRSAIDNNLSMKSASGYASAVGTLLEDALDTKIIAAYSRVKQVLKKRKPLSPKADKQIISDTFSFGAFLLELCQQLTLEKLRDRLPILLSFSNGSKLEEWSGLIEEKGEISKKLKPCQIREMAERRERWHTETSWPTRYPLINLRIEAELLIFIAQTGMNLAQAHKIKIGDFRYSSYNEGYQVKRAYKSRASAEVEFEIYSEYRVLFEAYLKWRNEIFLDIPDERLFPIKSHKRIAIEVAPNFDRIRARCRLTGIKYVGPRELRKTRVNWLLRKSANPHLVAEMAQHSTETLHREYERPNHQTAMVEITLFNQCSDIGLSSPGPGICVKGNEDLPVSLYASAARPDCINSAGCLFCTFQRDLPTFDYIWSLTSYRRYQVHLLATNRFPESPLTSNPGKAIVERLTAKISAFNNLGVEYQNWVSEAALRIEEEDYHPNWDIFIRLVDQNQ